MCCPQQIAYEIYRDIELSVYLNDNEFDVSGKWSKEKLLVLLKQEILEINKYDDSTEEIECTNLNNIISRGIYNETVISKLLRKGMSKESIIRSMKYGVQNLRTFEQEYFSDFNITPETLNYKIFQTSNLANRELIAKLGNLGFSEDRSINIVLSGLINQNECCLFQLTINGIATTKILNWKGPLLRVPERMLMFMQKLGIDQNTLDTAAENGINEDIQNMLKDLGYSETSGENLSIAEDLKSCCSLEIEEEIVPPCVSSSQKLNEYSIKTETYNVLNDLSEDKKQKILERKNYIRQNLMAPLTWAISRTLEFNPTNPVHYIACQLIKYKYNLNPSEVNKTLDYVIEETEKRDQIYKKQLDKEREDALECDDEPCDCCLKKMQLHRVKKRTWKYTKKWVPKYTACDLQDRCSSCRISKPRYSETKSLIRFKLDNADNNKNNFDTISEA